LVLNVEKAMPNESQAGQLRPTGVDGQEPSPQPVDVEIRTQIPIDGSDGWIAVSTIVSCGFCLLTFQTFCPDALLGSPQKGNSSLDKWFTPATLPKVVPSHRIWIEHCFTSEGRPHVL
jgi:hypothetical protein